jgi:hypothetical protein
VRETVGLPGTGLSYTHLQKPHSEPQRSNTASVFIAFVLLVAAGVMLFRAVT